jgi:nucleoside-diphosphate kinase
MEHTLVIIKPDAVERNLIGQIIDTYERNNLKVIQMNMIKPTLEQVKKHYSEHQGKYFYDRLVEYLTSGDVVVLLLEGKRAIDRVRKLNGKTNPQEAEEGTLRKRFGIDFTRNSVHASDSEEKVAYESAIWLTKS